MKEKRAPVPVWNGPDYVRVPEGRYRAVAIRYQGPVWVHAYSRWSLLVEFELLDDGKHLCAFYNFGDNRDQPTIARGSKYFKDWTLANDELPRRGQDISPEVFMEGQVFTIEVKDSRQNAAEQDKAEAEIYSVVSKIVSVDRPKSSVTNQKIQNQRIQNPESGIKNQESRITQSRNHAIRQSTNQAGQPEKTLSPSKFRLGRAKVTHTQGKPKGAGAPAPAQASDCTASTCLRNVVSAPKSSASPEHPRPPAPRRNGNRSAICAAVSVGVAAELPSPLTPRPEA